MASPPPDRTISAISREEIKALLDDIGLDYFYEQNDFATVYFGKQEVVPILLWLSGEDAASQGLGTELRLLYEWRHLGHLGLRAVNAFNREHCCVKATLAGAGHPYLELGMSVSGTSLHHVKTQIEQFILAIAAFEAFLSTTAPAETPLASQERLLS